LAAETDEIIERGYLECEGCGGAFEIKNGIPRFVKSDRYVSSFSFLWRNNPNAHMWEKSEEERLIQFQKKSGFSPADLKGKLVLDAGCGAGRFMKLIQDSGGIAVGADMSDAVDFCCQNCGDGPNIFIVQADIAKLPFREEFFDLIFSIGVLHHTSNCKEHFKKLPIYLKKHGQISIWVYPGYEYLAVGFTNLWRKITTRLPNMILFLLCCFLANLYYVYKLPFVRKYVYPIISTFLWVSTRPGWWKRVFHTFDWYGAKYQSYHTYAEVWRWFEECGLKNLTILEHPVGLKGEKI